MTPTGNEKYEFNVKGPDNPGSLRDVAPTVLDVMGVEIPEEMDGESRIKH
jgi:bisphosphoglycerate-independent phosphoglycerate mutase (AlkP superfamily)